MNRWPVVTLGTPATTCRSYLTRADAAGQSRGQMVSQYGPDTTPVQTDGSPSRGLETGDLALIGGEWAMTVGGEVMCAVTAEIAQRRSDGGWHQLIDHPYGLWRRRTRL